MRTEKEILARIEERRPDDFLGFEWPFYAERLTYATASQFYNDTYTEEDHVKAMQNTLDPIEELKLYMEFAWDKANGCRGISANRSIMHIIAWLWLAEEEELLSWVEDEYMNNYEYYGKPILERVCDYFGIDWRQYDNGERTNSG